MKIVLRPIPVVFACRGCERDAPARQAAAELDRRGEGEASVMGRDAAKARSRFPVYVIEGCDKRCATQWLDSIGVHPERTALVNGDSHHFSNGDSHHFSEAGLFGADGE